MNVLADLLTNCDAIIQIKEPSSIFFTDRMQPPVSGSFFGCFRPNHLLLGTGNLKLIEISKILLHEIGVNLITQ